MRYLIITNLYLSGQKILMPPFLTNYFDAENNFNSEIDMVVYDLYLNKYTEDGKNWYNIEIDHLQKLKDMTPKEKANELIEKFLNKSIAFPYIDTVDKQCIGLGYMTYNSAVKCTIIAVDEIIDQWDYVDTSLANLGGEFNPNLRYWQEVKTELEKLKD